MARREQRRGGARRRQRRVTGRRNPGAHGLGLLGVSLNGTELADGAVVALRGEETPELEVRVQNQGESTENEISVSVKVNGGRIAGHDRIARRRAKKDRG